MSRWKAVAWAVAMVLAAAGAAGCRAEVPPETVARQFYDLCEVGRQNGFHVVQEEVFALLNKPSQQVLRDCADAANEGRAESDRKLRPEECFQLVRFDGKRGEFEAERTASGANRVRLKITSAGTDRVLEMVLEDAWKVDLVATVELNRQPAAPEGKAFH
jgi:hypothetical protein